VRSHPGSLFYQAFPKVPFWVHYSSILIYINDIVLGTDSEICSFADDCILYREIRISCEISNHLRWHEHVNNVSAKATKTLNFINVTTCIVVL